MVGLPALNIQAVAQLHASASPVEIVKYVRQAMVFDEEDYHPEKLKSRSMDGCSSFKGILWDKFSADKIFRRPKFFGGQQFWHPSEISAVLAAETNFLGLFWRTKV